MIIEEIQAKTLIRTSNRSPHHIHMNLYQGCYHNCAYCNGISDNYFMHKDFSYRIRAKINAPTLLEKFLRKQGFLPKHTKQRNTMLSYVPNQSEFKICSNNPDFLISLFGNVCDIYQPAEAELQITRQILKIAYKYSIPIRILTKSNLVLRDIDILKKINEKSFGRVAFTITLDNEEDQKNFEPNASTTSERIDAIWKLRKEGIPAGAYITPVIPFIGDTDKNLRLLIMKLKDANTEFVITGGLTLKPGRNKSSFMSVIKKHYPTLLPKFLKLYGNNNAFGQPNHKIACQYNLVKPEKKGYELCQDYGVTFFEPRFIPDVRYKRNLEVASFLARIGFLKERILEEPWRNARIFREAASILEYLDRDIEEMTDSDIAQLHIDDRVIPHIIEVLDTGRSRYLVEHGDTNNLFF